ncbi:MAG TPA: hypothetical protein VGK34_04815 [Armatimonadota bacterium]
MSGNHKSIDNSSITFLTLFEAVWFELKGILGNAPAAVIVRRAAELSLHSHADLGSLQLRREGTDYVYTMSGYLAESTVRPNMPDSFFENLFSIMSELTGSVLIRHLADNAVISPYLPVRDRMLDSCEQDRLH